MKSKKTKASQSSPAPSANKSRYKHHRKVPRKNTYKDDNYSDASLSESNKNGYEYERPANDDDNDDAYIGSESETNAPGDRFSSQLRDPDSQSINLSTTAFPNSTSNFPKISQPPSTHLASYMNIAPFPIFHGNSNECPVKHVSRFAKVCVANNVSTTDMMMRIFPVTLEDEAALWYDLNIEPYPSLTWEEIKSSFLHAYHKIEVVDQLRSELMMINQGDGESVRSYFLRLQWILKQWPDHGISDGLLKGVFIDGLREEFRGWIIPQKPDSLHEALRLAFGFEQVKSIRAVRKELKCGFCDGMHEERDCEVRGRMRKLWRERKEKEGAVVLAKSTGSDDELGKELVRSVSIGASSGVGKNNEGEEAGFMDGKKNQFQYWKYQRWMKKLERNNSLISAIPNAEIKACNGHFDDYSFNTAQSCPQYYSVVSKPDPTRISFAFPRPDYAETMSYDYPLFPNYMANTESSRTKACSQSAPKQRPPDSIKRQRSQHISMEGRNVARAVRMQRSSSHVDPTTQNYQYPLSIKLDKSTVSLKDN